MLRAAGKVRSVRAVASETFVYSISSSEEINGVAHEAARRGAFRVGSLNAVTQQFDMVLPVRWTRAPTRRAARVVRQPGEPLTTGQGGGQFLRRL